MGKPGRVVLRWLSQFFRPPVKHKVECKAGGKGRTIYGPKSFAPSLPHPPIPTPFPLTVRGKSEKDRSFGAGPTQRTPLYLPAFGGHGRAEGKWKRMEGCGGGFWQFPQDGPYGCLPPPRIAFAFQTSAIASKMYQADTSTKGEMECARNSNGICHKGQNAYWPSARLSQMRKKTP